VVEKLTDIAIRPRLTAASLLQHLTLQTRDIETVPLKYDYDFWFSFSVRNLWPVQAAVPLNSPNFSLHRQNIKAPCPQHRTKKTEAEGLKCSPAQGLAESLCSGRRVGTVLIDLFAK
jgi:hypothetical protein